MTNKGEYIEPWTRQKELRKKYSFEEVPSLDELRDIIEQINIGKVNVIKQTKRARALFAMYYLTGCRVSEITRVTKLRVQQLEDSKRPIAFDITSHNINKNNKMVAHGIIEHDYPGIKKKNIVIAQESGIKCLYIRTENRKNKERTTKRQPIPIEFEKHILQYIIDYAKGLEEETILFDFTPKRATQIINEATGFNIHFIRHIRATHLITLYDFNEQTLIKFMGWTDARPAKHYMELSSKDILTAFYKNKKVIQ